MKIFTGGGQCEWCQVPRIAQALRELGHEITENPADADLVYVNNPWYDDIIALRDAGKLRGKIIFNVLDIPEHIIAEFDTEKLKRQLSYADAVTSISEYTQSRLEHHTGIKSTIIYQPIMPITFENTVPRIPYSFIGRKHDANKRVAMGVHALWLLGVKSEEVAMVGHERVEWGTNLGLVTQENLSRIYNASDFVFCLGKVEGLNLPVIESMAGGAIPIICDDMTTREELLPSYFFPEYDKVLPNPTSIAMFIAQFQQDNDAKANFKERLRNHYNWNLKHKFSAKSVAEKIIAIYDGLPRA